MEQLNIFALFTCDNDFVVQEDGNKFIVLTPCWSNFYCTS